MRQCPECGLTERDIVGAFNVGCGLCYTVFFDLVSPTIWNCQGSTVHHGKTPLPRPQLEEARAAAFREAIKRARSEGRAEDVEVLNNLLRLLGDDPH